MKKLFLTLGLVSCIYLSAAQADTDLPQVCTPTTPGYATAAEQPVNAACGGRAQTGQVYKVPVDADLVRVRKSGATFADWSSTDYVWRRWSNVKVGDYYDTCRSNVTPGSLVTAPGCTQWGMIARVGAPVVNTTGVVKLTWEAPTLNEDGSALTDLSGFYVYQGTSQTSLVKLATNLGPTARELSLSLPVGTFYFALSAYSPGGESAPTPPITVKVEKPAPPPSKPGTPREFKAIVTVTVP